MSTNRADPAHRASPRNKKKSLPLVFSFFVDQWLLYGYPVTEYRSTDMAGPAEPALADAILNALRPELIAIVHAELQKASVLTADELWLTDREVAARFNIPVKTLQHWRCIGRGGPEFHKHGRAVRYRLSEVEEWNVDRQ
jgi:hypothetical protein